MFQDLHDNHFELMKVDHPFFEDSWKEKIKSELGGVPGISI
jgi:hypothetical protein